MLEFGQCGINISLYFCETTNSSLTVGNNSCHGQKACRVDPSIRLPGTSFTIHDNSCIAPDEDGVSCYNVGARADVVEIGPNACIGFGACWSIGEQATGTVTLHANSLHGASAGSYMGISSSSVKVEEGACVCPAVRSDWEAGTCCYMMAVDSPVRSLQVKAGACSAPRACQVSSAPGELFADVPIKRFRRSHPNISML